MRFTPRINKAIKRSAVAHALHKRKGTEIPYVTHVVAAMCIASEVTDDEDTLIACLLHDVLEDVPDRYSKAEIEADFGKRVVRIVEGVTKEEDLPDWQDRADRYLSHLLIADQESVIVCAADKIHNLMSILEDQSEVGNEVWNRFNTGKERQQWWYQEVHKVLVERIPDNPLTSRLGALVAELISL